MVVARGARVAFAVLLLGMATIQHAAGETINDGELVIEKCVGADGNGCPELEGLALRGLTQAKKYLGPPDVALDSREAVFLSRDDLEFACSISSATMPADLAPNETYAEKFRNKIVFFDSGDRVLKKYPDCFTQEQMSDFDHSDTEYRIWRVHLQPSTRFPLASAVIKVYDSQVGVGFYSIYHGLLFPSAGSWWDSYREWVDPDSNVFLDGYVVSEPSFSALQKWQENDIATGGNGTIVVSLRTESNGYIALSDSILVVLVFQIAFPLLYLSLAYKAYRIFFDSGFKMKAKSQAKLTGGKRAIRSVVIVNGIESVFFAIVLSLDGYAMAANMPDTFSLAIRPMGLMTSVWSNIMISSIWVGVIQSSNGKLDKKRQWRITAWASSMYTPFLADSILALCMACFIGGILTWFVVPVILNVILIGLTIHFARVSLRLIFTMKTITASSGREENNRERRFQRKIANGLLLVAMSTLFLVFACSALTTDFYFASPSSYLVVNFAIVGSKFVFVLAQLKLCAPPKSSKLTKVKFWRSSISSSKIASGKIRPLSSSGGSSASSSAK